MEPNADKIDSLLQAASPGRLGEPARFCPNCGTKAEPGAIFCGNCGSRLADTPPTPHPTLTLQLPPTPDPVPPSASVPENRKHKNTRLPWLMGGVAAAALAVGILAMPKGTGEAGGAGRPEREVFYIKGRSLCGASLESAAKKPVVYTDHFADSDTLDTALHEFRGAQLVSKDGKYHFFIADVEDPVDNGTASLYNQADHSIKRNVGILGDDGTYTLYSQKGNQDPVKVDSGIQKLYRVTDDNKAVYMKKGGLYVSGLKDKTKIAADVTDFMVDQAGKNVLWLSESGGTGTYDLYHQGLAMKKNKKKLAGGFSSVRAISRDLNKVLIEKDNTLYLVRSQGGQEKLADDVYSVLNTDLDKGVIFYLGLGRDSVNAMDYVIDDMAGQSAMRAKLSSLKIDNPYFSLYVYSNGESRLISDRIAINGRFSPFIFDVDRKNNQDLTPYQFYQKAADSPGNKVKLSDISDVKDFEDRLNRVKYRDVTACLYAGGKNTDLGRDVKNIFDGVSIDEKNNQLYCLLTDPNDLFDKGELVSIPLSGVDAGKMTKHDSDVDSIVLVSDGTIYYMKNTKGQDLRMSGDLYCGGRLVLADASPYRVTALPDSSAVLCLSEPDGQGNGSLMYLKGKTAVKIADEVSDFHAFGEDSIVLLTDYNDSSQKGELKYYNGKTLRSLDSDVRSIFY